MSLSKNSRFEKTHSDFHPSILNKDGKFLSTIVKIGSLQRAETQLSGLSCPLQDPDGENCDGNILILKKPESQTIYWACNTCDESGEVSGSIPSEDEFSSAAPQFKTEPVEEMELSVVFTAEEYSFLLDTESSYLDSISEHILFSAKKGAQGVDLTAGESQMETFYASLLFLSKQPEHFLKQQTYVTLAQKVRTALDWACFS